MNQLSFDVLGRGKGDFLLPVKAVSVLLEPTVDNTVDIAGAHSRDLPGIDANDTPHFIASAHRRTEPLQLWVSVAEREHGPYQPGVERQLAARADSF